METAVSAVRDPFLEDPFYPLEQANSEILAALRADEASPDADLFRKIAHCSNSYEASNNNNHGTHNAAAVAVPRQGFEYRVTPTTAAFLAKSTSSHSSSSTAPVAAAAATAGHIHRSIQHTKSIPLPQHLAETLAADTQLVSLMGTFPDARLVWVSVDNTLYIWEYETNDNASNTRQDFVAFTVPTGQVIVSVGLVPPKPGVFKQVVEWCIVVTTPEEVILCALARSSVHSDTGTSDYDSVLRLIPTSYIVPTDSVPILSVQGTRDGRIFLGGYDGCLYEMAYEGNLSSLDTAVKVYTQEPLEDLEDEKDAESTSANTILWSETMRLTTALLAGTKRTLSHWTFGPTTSADSSQASSRPRKCRKINHTSLAPSIVQALVPNFILRVASSALSFTSSNYTVSNAGPMIQLVMDHHRQILYALTEKGFVHAFQITAPSTTTKSSSSSLPPIRYACTVDLPKSAHRYLDNVARARPFPPSLPFTADSEAIAAIVYPGGASAASAGVGGMENARFLLKLADQQGKEGSASRTEGASKNKNRNTSQGILHPISIHIVPPSASTSLTLVAVTSGGLRYYLSVLPNVGNSFNMNDSSFRREVGVTSNEMGRRFTLAHIRSPPPFRVPRKGEEFQDISIDLNSQQDTQLDDKGILHKYVNGSLQPGQSREGNMSTSVSRALYWNNVTWLAVNHHKDWHDDSTVEPFGDSIITLTPDTTLRTPAHAVTGSNASQLLSGSGLGEIVSFPTVECRSNAHESSVLGGGHIWDFSCSSIDFGDQALSTYLSVRRLIIHSRTPSDTELSTGMISPFVAPPRQRPLSKDFSSIKSPFGKVKSSLDTIMTSHESSRRSVQPLSTAASLSQLPHSQRLLFSSVGLLTRQILQRLSNYAKQDTPEVDRIMVSLRKYRIHNNTGCSSVGFAISTISPQIKPPQTPSRVNGTNISAPCIRSERLSPWLVHPREATLPDVSLQHPALSWYKPHFVALNSGGVHIFSESSPIDQLRDQLATTNTALLGKDERVQSYFFNYGFLEACVMCLSIAITAVSDEMKAKAIQAALSYAHRPTMIRAPSTSWTGDISGMQPSSNSENLIFQPSYLYQALVVFSSRLLRPIWYKPAIVVTEGRAVPSKTAKVVSKLTPAKVEFLLDEMTLQEIRQSLVILQNIIKLIFNPVIATVPESPMFLNADNSSMHMDLSTDDQATGMNLLTTSMQLRAKALTREAGPQKMSDGDIIRMAKLTEERKIHSLYRLLSRTTQVLSLMTHLYRAHFTPELPDVEFGLLHGLTFCQLVTKKTAHERIEMILSNVLSTSFSSDGAVDMSSIESSNFTASLGNECFLLFSSGCRYTFLGFKVAHEALKQPLSTVYRKDLSDKAGNYLRKAAFQWSNAELVSGLLLHGVNDDTQINLKTLVTEKKFISIAKSALERGSPLARAANILMDLDQVSALVDVCLICAKNFCARRESSTPEYGYLEDDAEPKDIFPWEKDLYLKHQILEDVPASTPSGIEVSKPDALLTCYAVLLYFMMNVLTGPPQVSNKDNLADEMIATAASSLDTDFLHLMYDFLLSTENVDRLLRIESTDLANWLRSEKQDLTLLWRHFTLHGLYSMAGQVMLERARCPVEKNVTLEERIESLTRAVNSFTAALETDRVPMNFDGNTTLSQADLRSLISQTNEVIEIALLQRRTVAYLEASGVQFNDITRIRNSLLSVSDLYNDFAVPYSLYDICLLIMHTCAYEDQDIIATLWKSIICEEILPCKTHNRDTLEFLEILKQGSMLEEQVVALIDRDSDEQAYSSLKLFENGEWVASLKGRIASLGKELKNKGSGVKFPLEWILDTLNGLQRVLASFSSSPSDTLWSAQVLAEIGFSHR